MGSMLSRRNWIPAFAGMTEGDITSLRNPCLPTGRPPRYRGTPFTKGRITGGIAKNKEVCYNIIKQGSGSRAKARGSPFRVQGLGRNAKRGWNGRPTDAGVGTSRNDGGDTTGSQIKFGMAEIKEG